MVVHSMDRLARNLDDLRALVLGRTRKTCGWSQSKRACYSPGELPQWRTSGSPPWGPTPNSNAHSSGNARGKASPWLDSAAPTKGGNRPPPERASEPVKRAGSGVPKVLLAKLRVGLQAKSGNTCARQLTKPRPKLCLESARRRRAAERGSKRVPTTSPKRGGSV